MKAETGLLGDLTTKLVACLLIVVCLAVGAVGLILPIIPGLLFLAIALMIIARHSPAVDRQLRKNRKLGRYLDSADGFLDLNLWEKVRYGCLLCVRLAIDAVAICIVLVARLLQLATGGFRSFRQT